MVSSRPRAGRKQRLSAGLPQDLGGRAKLYKAVHPVNMRLLPGTDARPSDRNAAVDPVLSRGGTEIEGNALQRQELLQDRVVPVASGSEGGRPAGHDQDSPVFHKAPDSLHADLKTGEKRVADDHNGIFIQRRSGRNLLHPRRTDGIGVDLPALQNPLKTVEVRIQPEQADGLGGRLEEAGAQELVTGGEPAGEEPAGDVPPDCEDTSLGAASLPDTSFSDTPFPAASGPDTVSSDTALAGTATAVMGFLPGDTSFTRPCSGA